MTLTLSNIIYKFKLLQLKISIRLFKEQRKLTPTFIGKSKVLRRVKTIFLIRYERPYSKGKIWLNFDYIKIKNYTKTKAKRQPID